MVERLSIKLDVAATPEEVRAVEAAARAEGFEAEVAASWEKPPQTGNGAFWMVEILVGSSLSAFFGGIAAAAGADAWKKIKSFAEQLREARAPSKVADSGNIVLRDSRGRQLMLWKAFPDEAYEALFQIDWDDHASGLLVWDDRASEWYDPNRPYGC
jgi:hypothetical protein